MLANCNLGEGPWEKSPGMLPVDITSRGVWDIQCMLPINDGKQLLSLCTTAVNPELAQVAYAIGDIYEK